MAKTSGNGAKLGFESELWRADDALRSNMDATEYKHVVLACKESRETHYWLRLIAETDLIAADRLQPMLQECHELIAILTTIIKKTRANSEAS